MTENIYKPPSSELNENPILKRSIWWKIYFFLITLISIFGLISHIVADGSGFPEYISLMSFVVATVGLFGFCFLIKILTPKFWMVYLFVYIAYGFIYLFITNVDVRMGMSDQEFYISWAIGLLISLPAYFGLFSYGRPGNLIWSKA